MQVFSMHEFIIFCCLYSNTFLVLDYVIIFVVYNFIILFLIALHFIRNTYRNYEINFSSHQYILQCFYNTDKLTFTLRFPNLLSACHKFLNISQDFKFVIMEGKK